MEEMTVADVIRALGTTRTVIIPIGGTEQHGHHLPLSTDSVMAEFIARGVSQRTGCVVAPCVSYSHSYGTLPGTTNIQPSTLTQVLVDIAVSLHEQGFSIVIIYPCHLEASTLYAARDAEAQLQPKLPRARVLVYTTSSTPAEAQGMLDVEVDGHAGAGETSVMLHIAPHMVRAERPYDGRERWWLGVVAELHQLDESGVDSQKRMRFVPPEDVLAAVRDAEPKHCPIKYGVFGDPNKADPEFARIVCEHQIEEFAKFIRELESRP
jgi:creatinine amidohydrolase